MGLKYVDVYHYYWIGFEGSLMRDQEGLMFHIYIYWICKKQTLCTDQRQW